MSFDSTWTHNLNPSSAALDLKAQPGRLESRAAEWLFHVPLHYFRPTLLRIKALTHLFLVGTDARLTPRDVMRRATWLIAPNFGHAAENAEIIRLLMRLVSAALTPATNPMTNAAFLEFINILDTRREQDPAGRYRWQLNSKFKSDWGRIKLPLIPFRITVLSTGDCASYWCCTAKHNTINNTINRAPNPSGQENWGLFNYFPLNCLKVLNFPSGIYLCIYLKISN